MKEAEIALANDENPDWLCVKDRKIIGRGHNARRNCGEAVVHAEVMAIEEASMKKLALGGPRLFLSPLGLVSCVAVLLV